MMGEAPFELYLDILQTLERLRIPYAVIVGKLMAWKEGRSFKHEQDIRDIPVAVRLNEEPEWTSVFDFPSIDRWAARLGPDVEALWKRLKTAAGV